MKSFRLIILPMMSVFLLCLSASAGAQSQVKYTAFGGFDLIGNAEQDSDYDTFDGDQDVNPGISLGIEGAMVLNKNVYAGLGFQGRLPRNIEEDDDIDHVYSAIIPYALVQIDFPDAGEVAPYIIAQLGVHIYFLDTGDAEDWLEDQGVDNPNFETSPGVYFGFGGGLHFTEKVGMRVLYSISKGENKFTSDSHASDDMSATITMLTFSVSYNF